MSTAHIVLAFTVATPLMAGFLWLGMKLTHVDGTIYGMLIISAVANGLLLAALIISPQLIGLGALLAAIASLALIVKLTDAEFWPDAVFMWVVAMLAAYFVNPIIFSLF